MSAIEFDAQPKDISESPYYKNLRESLRKKADEAKKASNAIQSEQSAKIEEETSRHSGAVETESMESTLDIEDQVQLSSLSFEEEFLSDEGDSEDQDSDEKQRQEQELRTNGERVLRYLGHKIDFKGKVSDLKLLMKESIIQARSHNFFLSQFAKFKVGVVGQILSALNVPLSELKELKREAIKEAFDENVEMMKENVYNQELAILMAKGKRKRRISKIYGQVQDQLVSQMNNLGRVGFWTKGRLMEERINQLKRIHDELSKERADLDYLLQYRLQYEEKAA